MKGKCFLYQTQKKAASASASASAPQHGGYIFFSVFDPFLNEVELHSLYKN